MTDETETPGTLVEVHGGSENVSADTPDDSTKTDIYQSVDELIDDLIYLDRAFEPNWTDDDIDLGADRHPSMVFTLPEEMLDQALTLKPDIPEYLQKRLVYEYVCTHDNPFEWAADGKKIQDVISVVRDLRNPSMKLYEVKPKGLVKRPTLPPVTVDQLLQVSETEMELDPQTPYPSAVKFVQDGFMHGGKKTLIRHNSDFCAWSGTRYQEVDAELLRAEIYPFLDGATYFRRGDHKRFSPNQTNVSQVYDALKSVTQLSSYVQIPSWLDETNYPPANEIVAFENGLLHLPSRTLRDHTPMFLSLTALPYEFDPDAPEPTDFFSFLDSIFDGDDQAEDLLQEIFGYIVCGATSQQKIFAVVGPKRAGKGVLGRLITALVGSDNVCSPSLGSFATNFPLQPLIGRTLALMSDARLDSKINQKAIVEHFLRISGEDDVNVARKNRIDWSGRLPTRLMLLTNEIPRLADPSGALAGRFVTLVLTKSFFGKEDPNLTERLLLELPGILNWALEGWDRVQEQGRFTIPASSREVMQELEHLSSPILKFIDDECVVGSSEEVPVDELYQAWKSSCVRDGQDHATTKATFARDLRAAVPSLNKVRRNISGVRVHYYVGIRLRVPKSVIGERLSAAKPNRKD
jgi:putative DNA primase/helicase